MPLPLDQQWVLEYPGVELVLGSSPLVPPHLQRGYHHLKAPAIGETTVETEDSGRPGGDGVDFGEDRRGGMLVTFELGLVGTSSADAHALSAALLRAWRGERVRDAPGALARLSTSSSGRLRSLYGRPRRCSVSHTAPRSALVLATCDFQTADDLFYGTAAESVAVSLVPQASGGFAAPFASPVTVTPPSVRTGSITVLGDVATWPVITVQGPITNPAVEVTGRWSLRLEDASLSAGQSAVIDCRPWVRTVLRSDGASLAGRLSRGSWLDRARLEPGAAEVALRGTDPTGTASMTFSWAPAYTSL